jgi:hypothetical protein
VNDSAAGLMGEGQEEDRRHIAELVLTSMEVIVYGRLLKDPLKTKAMLHFRYQLLCIATLQMKGR